MIKLVGILIVIVGFALKMDSIAIVLGAGLVTGLVGGLSITEMLEIFGKNFVANRTMCIFIIIMLVTGTLERNGLQNVAANIIRKVKNASAGLIVGIYGVLVTVLGAFNTGLGGAPGFIRPVVLPMAEGAVMAKHGKPNEEHLETIRVCQQV